MRINRETLLKIAQDTAAQRTRADRGIQSVYLCGSLLREDYLLGGTADIDLVFIHIDPPLVEREIIRLTDDVTLDIAHHGEKAYRQARRLREHRWLGPTIAECKTLYDPHHLMDFTQASVRGQFYQPEHVLARVQPQVEHAREIWLSNSLNIPKAGPVELANYLRAVEHAANAVAGLTGYPLTERRFLLDFPGRAEAAGSPGLFHGILGLIGGPKIDAAEPKSWLPDWQLAVEALSEGAVPRLQPVRIPYYRKAFESMLNKDQPLSALWPMLRTWTDAAQSLAGDPAAAKGWQQACERLGLLGDDFAGRISALDAFLDTVEETVERWARANGAE
jgi:hypothetical protein